MAETIETSISQGKLTRMKLHENENWEKYLSIAPLEIRHVLNDLSKMEIKKDELGQITLRLRKIEVPVPDPHNPMSVTMSVELLLRRTNIYDKFGHYASNALMLVSTAVSEVIQLLSSNESSGYLNIEIKNVSEREELSYRIVKQIMDEYIIKTFYITISTRQSVIGMYCFDGVVYRPCDLEIEKRIEELASANEDMDKKTVRWVVNEAKEKIKRKTLTPLRYERLVIAFKNVLFDWNTFLETGSIRKAVLSPNPDIIVFHKIPHSLRIDRLDKLEGLQKFEVVHDLEELAKQLCPKTLQTFKQWVNEKWPLLFEIIGYVLYPKYDLHKAIMLVGSGSNGKSKYLNLIKDIIGKENFSSVKLQDLTDSRKRFAAAELYHKLANIYPDLPSEALKDTGTFKALTGEDTITVERKYRDPIVFENYAKLLFSANELPKVKDMTPAFWRRWLVIEFPNTFPLDPTFYERTFTEDEIEGAILISLMAFREVWRRRKFSFEGSGADYKELWLRSTNSVYAFIQDLLNGKVDGYTATREPNAKTEADELYSVYSQYCRNNDREDIVSKKIFTEELARLGFKKVKIGNKRYYKGILMIKEGASTLM